MNFLAQFINRYARLIIVLVLVITIFGISQIHNLKVEDDITKYLSENDPEIVFYQEVADKFGNLEKNVTMVSLEYPELFTLENLQNFKLISEQLEKSDYIVSVGSFLNMPKIIATDYGLEVKDFVDVFPQTEQEVQELQITALEDDMLKGTYLSENGKITLLMVESLDNIDASLLKKELEQIVNKYKVNVKHIEYFGLPIMEEQITDMARDNMSLAFIATIVVLALLFYCFRSIQGTLLPISLALLTSFWLLSAVAAIGKPVTIVISAIPVLMIALSTAYGIHFISRYYEERQLSAPLEATKKTIAAVFTPILMSALTTMAGFFSLATVVIKPMTEFGVLATIGIFAAFLMSIFLLGAIFSIFIPKKVPQNFSYQAHDLVTRTLKSVAQSIFSKKKLVFGTIIVVLIISGFFALQIKPDSSIENRLGENNPISKSLNYLKDNFGGADFLYIYLTAENVKQPYILRSIDKIQNYARHLDLLSYPSSITTFIEQLNNAMENKRIIPSNPDKIDNLWFFADDNEYLNSMIADDGQSTIIQARAREMTSFAIDHDIQKVKDFIETIPDTVREVELSSLPITEQKKYLPFIAEDIVFSWQANGLNIDESQKQKLLAELTQVAQMPLENFYYPTDTFLKKVLYIAALELEDFGLTTDSMEPMLLQYLENYAQGKQFVEYLALGLGLDLDDAEYLKQVIDSSLLIAGEREKIRYAVTTVEQIVDNKLDEKNSEYLWYLTDDYVYLPDEQGGIHFSYRLTGTPVILNAVNTSVFQGQIKSMITAFIIVFILLVLQFGSLLTGLIAMVPIACTVLTAFGIMGLMDISLNIGTMMVASIAIGAGIDYTIHFVSRYKQELTKSKDYNQAIKNTLTGTGRAIVFNSLAVAAGAYVLTLSEIDMIAEFSGLIGSLMLISVVYTLLLLPLLLHFNNIKKSVKL